MNKGYWYLQFYFSLNTYKYRYIFPISVFNRNTHPMSPNNQVQQNVQSVRQH